jgi:Tol biopolymer transport system component
MRRILLALSMSLLLLVPIVGAMGVGAAFPGDELAFFTRNDCCSSIYRLDLRTRIQQILPFESHDASAPSWSPDGTRIAFWARDRSRLDTSLKLCIAEPEGMNIRCTGQITYRNDTPAWSPDGTSISFADVDSVLMLNVNALDQPPDAVRPGGSRFYYQIALSPDGSKIAYIGAQDEANSIYVLDLEANETRWLTTGLYPAWSPDGTQLAYHTAFDERLMTVAASDGTPVYITDGRDADWSPDGKWLAFVGGEPAFGETNIVIRHLDSGREITLVSNGRLNLAPAWRPR